MQQDSMAFALLLLIKEMIIAGTLDEGGRKLIASVCLAEKQ